MVDTLYAATEIPDCIVLQFTVTEGAKSNAVPKVTEPLLKYSPPVAVHPVDPGVETPDATLGLDTYTDPLALATFAAHKTL